MASLHLSLLLASVCGATAFVTPAGFGMTPALRSSSSTSPLSSLRMTGFGKKVELKKGDGAKKKITGIARKILQDYGDLVKGDSKDFKVFAGVIGEEGWFQCGNIASKGDNTAVACQFHKRLILEYACDLYPVLKTKRTKLQVGYCGADESDDKVVVLEKPENTEGCESGFLPLPRAGADNGKNLFHIDGRAMPRSQMPVGAADEKGNIK